MIDKAHIEKLNSFINLKNKHYKGILIVVDGIDGSGKTTIVDLIYNFISNFNIECYKIKMGSKEIKQISYIKNYTSDHSISFKKEIDLLSISLLFGADFLYTLRGTIIPLLEQGKCIICDRYVYVSLAELIANKCTKEDLETIKKVHQSFIKPDISIITQLSPNLAVSRVHNRPDEKDAEIDISLWGKFIDAFKQIACENNLLLINTSNKADDTFKIIKPYINKILISKGFINESE